MADDPVATAARQNHPLRPGRRLMADTTGNADYVPPAKRRLTAHDAGVCGSLRAIAKAAGLSSGTVHTMLHGRRAARRGGRRTTVAQPVVTEHERRRRPKPTIHIRRADLGMRPMQGDELAQRFNERWYLTACGIEAPSGATTNTTVLGPLAAAFGVLCDACRDLSQPAPHNDAGVS